MMTDYETGTYIGGNDRVAVIDQILGEEGKDPEQFRYHVDDYLLPDVIEGRRVLDVGGGEGLVALHLRSSRGAQVDVLDAYAGRGGRTENQEVLRQRLAIYQMEDVRVIHSDVRDAEIEYESYDILLANHSLHHIFNRGAARGDDCVVHLMQRFREWLVPGGRLVIGEVGWGLAWRLIPPVRKRFFSKIHYPSKSGYRRWRDCAMRAGFQPVAVRWYVPFGLRRMRRFLGHELPNAFTGAKYVIELLKPW